ncbi:hypothetical protein U1P98_09905 [Lysinibacillus irui]|uniref:Aminodeoxychorismate lyase n=1 Tax=Lysinibacillus irui TaxID=2998077 RepID=A0ABU5NKP6_9BACI|nr:hypothetical protein [Lysinibacillus irui]MEA0554890.1 hypothetical protein [Lysinibacillus irui]MEA0563954.1 hypothetical protein [Lysinibacillus irui]MEA0976605.1 hypothetical protein [Lysinibacillus irui]MEA1042759.1 hypothetical protein [Lysinibacillus irui]
MNKSAIRAFGIAIFLVGALLALAGRYDVNMGLPMKDSPNLQQVEELQMKLDKANKEIASLKEQLKPVHKTEETSSPDASEQSADKTNTDEKMMTLQIYSGITPYIVAQKLEDGGIITNSVEMELLLANAKYARSLQIGSYEVNSSMTLEEIAKLITGKKQ